MAHVETDNDVRHNKGSPSSSSDQSLVLPTSRWLVVRTDILLMPLLTICLGMQYYDKAVLGSATLFGILTDLELTGKRYSQANACFYYGYLVGSFPMSILTQRFKAHLPIFLGSMIILWGGVLMLTCLVSDYRGLFAQRCFLGFIEASVSPCFIAITRTWYTKSEQPLRLGIWWSAVGLFSIVSGLINHSLGEANTSLAPWKLIFLVPGSITIVFGLMLMVLLPASPLASPLLRIPGYNRFSLDQRITIDAKVRANLTGSDQACATWDWAQAREAALEPQIWIFFLMATSIYVTNGAVTVFGPLLVKSMGYTSLRATLLLTPGGATASLGIYFFAYMATRMFVVQQPFARTALTVTSCWPIVIGAAMCWRGDWANRAVPLAGLYLLYIFGAPFVMVMGSCTANIAGSTKQAIASAAIFVGYNCGNIASSYILVADEAKDHYPTTFQIIIGCMCATQALALLQGALLARENRRRDRLYGRSIVLSATGPVVDEKVVQTLAEQRRGSNTLDVDAAAVTVSEEIDASLSKDLTDRQNVHFRYLY